MKIKIILETGLKSEDIKKLNEVKIGEEENGWLEWKLRVTRSIEDNTGLRVIKIDL